ncbi:phage virion morphogenesis protein [Sphingomonas kyeonggiensis]|uniref:phage virion morphogenesis protein n=1 Tax=Sphingomonas kyeonggiensis TaxID=1268553 RepID=UPI00277FC641|nr:phage virion morphogenesis protein [Sphingomonas kyeonggiensis]MDQ0250968.1 phage virion morphogenesis protein [Sphingomonas kyeonggiensis]
MSDPLDPLDHELARLAASIAPPARKKLAGAIANDLRASNAKRIRANVQPDGERMEPRKASSLRPASLGAVARKKKDLRPPRMFQKAPGYLVKRATAAGAELGFSSSADRIMSVHQLGLVDQVSDKAGSPKVAYPERVVLGLSDEDRDRLTSSVITHIGGN